MNDLEMLLKNPTMSEEGVLTHPTATVRMIATFSRSRILRECIPVVAEWEEAGEEVCLRRVRDYIVGKYGESTSNEKEEPGHGQN